MAMLNNHRQTIGYMILQTLHRSVLRHQAFTTSFMEMSLNPKCHAAFGAMTEQNQRSVYVCMTMEYTNIH